MSVFDLDAVIAEREALPDFVIRFGGQEYSCPGEMDLRVLGLMTKGLIGQALDVMLGKDQVAALYRSAGQLPAKTIWSILEAYSQHSGIDVGEGLASTSSSPNAESK